MFRLKAVDLMDKDGFEDGRLLSDWFVQQGLWELGGRLCPTRTVHHPDDPLGFETVVLGELVKRHLGPLVGHEIRVDSSHGSNPARFRVPEDDRPALRKLLAGINVEVGSDDVMAIVNEFRHLATLPNDDEFAVPPTPKR